MTREPYRLFDYYRYEDRDLLFGRDEEVARLVGDILSSRLLALFAPSGSGKSSLLRAGVQPALEKRKFDAVFTRVGEDPIASLVTALETLDSTPSRGAPDLITALTGRTTPVVVFIDQFEELFLHFSEDSGKRKDFPVKLAEALFDPSLSVYFVLSLRSEYFVCLNEFRDAIPTIFHNNANLELRPFDDAAARDAIVGPSERGGFTWEKDLPERIVRDLKDPEINPRANGVLPLTLQVVCHTLWSRLPDGRGEITASSYEAEGGAAAIIERRIFQALEATPARDRRLLCRLLRELITKDGTKRIQSLTRLHDALGASKRKRTNAIVARFNRDLLFREETSRGETWVELRHDYLAARIKPWLDEEERRLDERRRLINAVAAVACAIVAAVGVWLWNDYHTYTAEIGSAKSESDPEDELVLTRRRPLGMLGAKTDFSLWKFSVGTGFSRPLLQDGGIPHNTFNVPNAPSDWTAIGEHLAEPARKRLVLATRLDALSSAAPRRAENPGPLPDFNALECPDIGYYAAADEKVLSLAFAALTTGNAKAKSLSANAMNRLGANLPAAHAEAIVEALLAALQDNESDVKRSAADTLGSLGASLPTARVKAVVEALLAAHKDNNTSFKSSAAAALGNLAAKLPADRVEAFVEALRAAIEDGDSDVKRSATDALGSLGASLPTARVKAVVEALLAALKNNDLNGKGSAAAALGNLAAKLPAGRADAFVAALVASLKDHDSDVKWCAADALGRLGANLAAEQTDAVVDALVVALKDHDSVVKRFAADALGSLGANLPAGQSDAVVAALLGVLKETDPKDLNPKSSAANALANLGANLPVGWGDAFVTALVTALKDHDSVVKHSAAAALGRLGVNLPANRADVVIAALLAMLKDHDPTDKSAAAATLGWFGANLPPSRVGAVVTALMRTLKDYHESFVRSAAAAALGNLGATLPAGQADAVVGALVAALKDDDFNVKRHTAAALGGLGAQLPASQADAVVEALVAALTDNDSFVKGAAAAALVSLGPTLPATRVGAVADALVAALKDNAFDHKRAAADALGNLGATLPAGRTDAVVGALVAALKDSDRDVMRAAAEALARLGAHHSVNRADAVVEALVAALKDKDLVVKGYTAAALGQLNAAVSRTQAETAITRLSYLLAARGTDDLDAYNQNDSVQRCIRQLTAHDNTRSSELLPHDLESAVSRERTVAIHMLARRSLSSDQLKNIRHLRDDPKHRPWVRMAALDTLMEIEREKDALARDKKEAEEKAKNEKAPPKEEE